MPSSPFLAPVSRWAIAAAIASAAPSLTPAAPSQHRAGPHVMPWRDPAAVAPPGIRPDAAPTGAHLNYYGGRDSYALTLTNRDDNFSGDASFTLYDDVSVR